MNNPSLNFYKYALAACVALLLVSVVAIINLNKNLQDSRQQIAQLEKHAEILSSSLDTIEACGGGSARCMMAEIFLPRV